LFAFIAARLFAGLPFPAAPPIRPKAAAAWLKRSFSKIWFMQYASHKIRSFSNYVIFTLLLEAVFLALALALAQ
jgi:hypothetical protein